MVQQPQQLLLPLVLMPLVLVVAGLAAGVAAVLLQLLLQYCAGSLLQQQLQRLSPSRCLLFIRCKACGVRGGDKVMVNNTKGDSRMPPRLLLHLGAAGDVGDNAPAETASGWPCGAAAVQQQRSSGVAAVQQQRAPAFAVY